ncbi:MAG: hypothetical protein H7A52_10795 [Akkermansiaceae bacterium]|nr:hypothetical protein [Akkermansiaceae bacterium]
MSYEDILQQSAGGSRGTAASLAVRVDDANPNHHLWNNRGTWWCHFTVHQSDYTAERVRVSLKTRDLNLARRRRDELLAAL